MGWEDDDNLTAFIDIFEPSCPEIKSATFKAPNHTRTTIGIGEEVEVKVRNLCGSTVNWSLTGGGTIMAQGPKNLEFQAGYVASTITLTVTLTNINSSCSSCQTSFTIIYDVIIPTGFYFDNTTVDLSVPQNIFHEINRVSTGYFADSYLLPDHVNFYNVKVFEDTSTGTLNGPYFSNSNLPVHIAGPENAVTGIVYPGKGSKIDAADRIRFIHSCRTVKDPSLPGELVLPIPNKYYNKDTNSWVWFADVMQTSLNVGGVSNSMHIVSKENSSNSTHVEDASSLWPGIPGPTGANWGPCP